MWQSGDRKFNFWIVAAANGGASTVFVLQFLECSSETRIIQIEMRAFKWVKCIRYELQVKEQ